MKFLKYALILTALALFIFACKEAGNTVSNNAVPPVSSNTLANTNALANAGASNSAPADEIALGKSIYMEKCVKCHKENGKGGEIEVLGVKRKASNFTTENSKNDADSDLIDIIENGQTEDGMPAFKDKLSDEQIKSVVKFIRGEFQGKYNDLRF
ncbi:MAG TPA: cytochrome c [Pyrinomonadaceae bacterium]|jgi:mono/diheme cytochrome c family protein